MSEKSEKRAMESVKETSIVGKGDEEELFGVYIK